MTVRTAARAGGVVAGLVASWVKALSEPRLQAAAERILPPSPAQKQEVGADPTGRPENMPPPVLAGRGRGTLAGLAIYAGTHASLLPALGIQRPPWRLAPAAVVWESTSHVGLRRRAGGRATRACAFRILSVAATDRGPRLSASRCSARSASNRRNDRPRPDRHRCRARLAPGVRAQQGISASTPSPRRHAYRDRHSSRTAGLRRNQRHGRDRRHLSPAVGSFTASIA
jgi:hypothetical protein